jgi:hypothetical protein
MSRRAPQPKPEGIVKPAPPPAPPLVTPINFAQYNPWVTKINSASDFGYLGEIFYKNGHLFVYQLKEPLSLPDPGIDLGELGNPEELHKAITSLIAKKLLEK